MLGSLRVIISIVRIIVRIVRSLLCETVLNVWTVMPPVYQTFHLHFMLHLLLFDTVNNLNTLLKSSYINENKIFKLNFVLAN